MVNHTDLQYEKGDICERTDAPADQGCLGLDFSICRFQTYKIRWLRVGDKLKSKSTYN